MRLTLLLLALSPLAAHAQSRTPAAAQSAPVVIEGAMVHIGNGTVYSGGYVVLQGGKITAVGQGAAPNVPAGAERISAMGKHVYPGLINPNNVLGLDEVGAIRATHDYSEVGDQTPEVLGTTAFNAASEVIPTVRANGVLTTMVTPLRQLGARPRRPGPTGRLELRGCPAGTLRRGGAGGSPAVSTTRAGGPSRAPSSPTRTATKSWPSSAACWPMPAATARPAKAAAPPTSA